jgi:hypothetical protein
MDIFSDWLFENMDSKYEEKMQQYGYEYVDSIKTPQYSMFLLKNKYLPEKYKYQVGLQRFDTDAFDYESQADLDKANRTKIRLNDQYGNIQIMFNKLMEWLNQYNNICVSSSQDTKTTKWLNTIQYLSDGKIKIKEESMMGHRIIVLSK